MFPLTCFNFLLLLAFWLISPLALWYSWPCAPGYTVPHATVVWWFCFTPDVMYRPPQMELDIKCDKSLVSHSCLVSTLSSLSIVLRMSCIWFYWQMHQTATNGTRTRRVLIGHTRGCDVIAKSQAPPPQLQTDTPTVELQLFKNVLKINIF